MTLGPPWTWEDAQETLSLQPDGSTRTLFSAAEVPTAEEQEEEEGSLSIEDEGFELLNSTYNKVTDPGKPGISRSRPRIIGIPSESVGVGSSLSPKHHRNAWSLMVLLSSQGHQPRRSKPLTLGRRTSPRRS